MVESYDASLSRKTVTWRCCRNFFIAVISLQVFLIFVLGMVATSRMQVVGTQHSYLESSSSLAQGLFKEIYDEVVGPSDERPTLRSDESSNWDLKENDIPGALTLNFLQERRHPSFRDETINRGYWDETAKRLSRQEKKPLRSCQEYSDDGRILLRQECSNENKQMLAYNPLGPDFSRVICGKDISDTVWIPRLCNESTVFPLDNPPLDGHGLNPIRLRKDGIPGALKPVDCDVPCEATIETCKKGSGEVCLSGISKWEVESTPFTFYYTTVSPNANKNTKVDRKAYRRHHYTVSTSMESEIPLSDFRWDKYDDRPAHAPDFKALTPSMAFAQTKNECKGSVRPNKWIETIQTSIPIHSYGECFNNKAPPGGLDVTKYEDRRKLFGKYMFVLITAKSTNVEDGVSDLVYEALWSGAIPVHIGGDLNGFVPKKSYISSSMFGTQEELRKKLVQVGSNQKLWEEYHRWRTDERVWKEFENRFEFVKSRPYCRMCKWSYAKKYGLGWDHHHQSIKSTSMHRDACPADGNWLLSNANGLKEMWVTSYEESDKPKGSKVGCSFSTSRLARLDTGPHKVQRTFFAHDGAIDFIIDSIEQKEVAGGLTLRLFFQKLQTSRGGCFPHVHSLLDGQKHHRGTSSLAIQGEQSRVTVLANWPTKLACHGDGTIDVVVQRDDKDDTPLPGEIRKIRVIMEDLDPLRKLPTDYHFSYYGSTLATDFMNPVEYYYTP